MINQERLVNEFMKYVKIGSESFHEKSFHDFILKILEDLGFHIIPDETGKMIGSDANNLIARRPGDFEGPTLGLCAHLDTVMPGNGIKPIIKDQIIYSEGNTILGADDKAGIAIILEIIQSAQENNLKLGPIEIFFSIAEETGILGSQHLNVSLEAKDYYVLDGIGAPGEMVIGGPGTNIIDVQVNGLSAHAGLSPENGINAIEVISSAISKMKLGRISPLTTANIGTIQGGRAVNIVCPSVAIQAEVRSHSEEELKLQSNHILECLDQACQEYHASYDYNVKRIYSAFKIDENNPFLLYSQKVIEELGLPYSAIIGGGGSDANNLSQLGINPIILGIGIQDCHTTQESIAISTLSAAGLLSYKLLENYWSK